MQLKKGEIGPRLYLPKNLRMKPKMPEARLKLMSNFSSTNTENSKTSLLMVNRADIQI